MNDYKDVYLKLFNATEDTINNLIKIQRECEEIIIGSNDIKVLYENELTKQHLDD